ncbi:MAG: C25 family cysteine peptidase, partial [Candidatus Cloacimonadia bacterium]
MKKSLIALILLVGIATISFAESRTISLGNPERMITITKNDYEKLELEIRLPEIISKDVETEKGMFSNLVIPNTYYIGEIGTPKLPALKKLIEVPFEAEVSVQVDDYSVSEFALSEFGITNPLIPVQPSLPKSVDAKTVEFAYNEQAYQKDQFIETDLATVEVLGVLRGARLARLVVAPVSYNPATGKIRIMNDIKISVNFSGSDPETTEYIKAATYSPYFDVVYDRILNSKDHDYPDHPDLTKYPVKYLIVSDPMFEDQLQPFIEWKTKKGFEVIVGYTDEIGSSFNNIQTWLHDHYNAGTPEDPAPSFVLLVGDTGQIPAQTGSTTSKATDLYYCSVDGDYFPEMYYGRFSASNPNQLQPQIDRTLYYEQYQFTEPAYLDDVTLIAGADATWNPRIGQPTILYGTQNYFNPSYGFDEVHAYLTNYSGCYDTIDDGISLINYTAHGSQTSWSNPNMGQSDVNNLVNVGKYPLAIGNCCLTGDFGYSECFGETWLRATHNTTGEPTGAIGYIGSAPSSYWFEDFYWAVGAFPIQGNNDGYVPTYDETSWGAYDAPFMSNYVTQDAILFVGNLAVTEAHVQGYPTHVSYGPIYYWQAYNLLGDPSIVPYLTQGEENDVNFAGMLPIGAESFTVSAEPGSYVAISMNGVLHGAALVDESGTVDVPIEPFTEAGGADIVVTKPQYQPVLTTVTVAVPAEVNIEPANIPVNIETEVTITVYEDDGTTPIPNVNIQANGLGVFGEVQEGITGDTGTCTLSIGSLYGGDAVILVGWREGDGYNLFEEILPVTGGASFTNPDLIVTTEVGLTDTFAMNLPGTI